MPAEGKISVKNVQMELKSGKRRLGKMRSAQIGKCLSVAERIVCALDDPSIYERYMRIKAKLMDDNSGSREMSSEARQLMIENKNLSLRLDELKGETERDHKILEWVIEQLQLIQVRIIPKASLVEYETFEDAADGLLEAIDTQVASHQFLKGKLAAEIKRTQEMIQAKKSEALSSIEKTRDDRVDGEARIERLKRKVQKKIKLLDEETESTEQQITAALEETSTLKAKLRKLKVPQDTDIKREQYEQKMNSIADEQEKMKQQIEQLKFALKQTNNEITERQRINHFMIPEDVTLDSRKQQLEQTITDLKKEHKLLQKQLEQFQLV